MSDDFEDRLRSWGRAEAGAAGSPPVFVAPAPRRLWPLVLAVAGVAGVVLAIVAVVGLRGGPGSRPASTASDTVPWAALPPAPDSGEPTLPPPTADPSVRLCRATDLRATQGFGDGGGGNVFTSFTLANRSTTPCRLTGRLDGLSGLHGGVRRQIRVNTVSSSAVSTVPVVLAPGRSGLLPFDYYPRCDTSPERTNPYSALRLSVLGGMVEVHSAGIDFGCGSASINAQSLGGQEPAPTYAPDPRQDLTVTVTAPATAPAGSVLRYVVTLSNPTMSAVALSPCPNFVQALGGVAKDLLQLNCAAAHPVPAGGGERFAMELRVPSTAPDGSDALSWSLALPGGKPPYVLVTVTGGAPPPTATTCSPGVTAVPCGPGMEVHVSYPYALYLHCGLRGLYADGRWWVPAAGDPPVGASGKLGFDEGAVTLDKPDRLLTWRSSSWTPYSFEPGAGPPPVCD